MPGLLSYKKRQIAAQLQLLAASEYFTTAARQGNGEYRKKTYPFVLPREFRSENLLSSIRQETETYFEDNKIAWHDARAHLLSSQIFCINFLGPFAQHPNALKELFEPLVGPIATMLEPEPKEVGRFVAFEFIGDPDVDYLNESSGRKRTRGANCTSADAAIRFQRPDGTTEFALIEWKYTESYRSSPSPQESEEQFNKRIEREHRYSNIAFAPNGPLRKDLSLKLADLFVDPIYQMLRQQMLAYRMEQAHELGAMRVIPARVDINTLPSRGCRLI